MSHGFTKECCTVPPVQAEYTPKGSYGEIGGLKTYEVGPEDAQIAVLFIYDIFGFTPQCLQGADMLAHMGWRVYMPDLLKGNPCRGEWFADNDDAKQQLGRWFGEFPGRIDTQSAAIGGVIHGITTRGHAKVGAIGLCWGYKALVSAEGVDRIDCFVGAHPSHAATTDAGNVHVPLLLIASKDEDDSIMRGLHAAMEIKHPGKNRHRAFAQSQHGFMGARANLHDEEQAADFRAGYAEVADFFRTHLS